MPGQDDAITAGRRLHGVAHPHRQLKPGPLPGQPDQPVAEALVEIGQDLRSVGGGCQRDTPVGMEVIDVRERQEAMQRRVDRGGHGVLTESAERIQLHHLVLERGAAVALAQGMELAQIERRKALPLDAAQIAAAALDPQHVARAAVQRIRQRELGAGVAPAKVGDAQIRAQQVGAVAEELQLVETDRSPALPA